MPLSKLDFEPRLWMMGLNLQGVTIFDVPLFADQYALFTVGNIHSTQQACSKSVPKE
ncbi:hypothetical protein DM860_012627 [Cuscuta australis]|uniref:Uncharacterized protein n=1 Tax=Cuscuta australis TaxID=267555 RepID=A0A328DDA8_9ASTE|nr:hypothetical protein DM860_012627 [Cuscuta australis]